LIVGVCSECTGLCQLPPDLNVELQQFEACLTVQGCVSCPLTDCRVAAVHGNNLIMQG
jgi:hypothetical protein